MGKVEALLKIITNIRGDFQYSKDEFIGENTQVKILDSFNAQPVIVEKGEITIFAQHEDGALIKDKIFEEAENLLDKGERILEKEFDDLIEGATLSSDNIDEDESLLFQFRSFIPASDEPLVRAGLFVRRMYKNNANVSRYKQLINQKYGSRGNNICNLVTAGYYENYLMPMYEHIKEDEAEEGSAIFGELYEEAVTQYPFAVFVSVRKTGAQVKEEIINKIKFNLLTGQNLLNIHGIGKTNRRTITAVLEDPEVTEKCISEPEVVELDKTIYVRMYF